jgi:hypothetical protein
LLRCRPVTRPRNDLSWLLPVRLNLKHVSSQSSQQPSPRGRVLPPHAQVDKYMDSLSQVIRVRREKIATCIFSCVCGFSFGKVGRCQSKRRQAGRRPPRSRHPPSVVHQRR